MGEWKRVPEKNVDCQKFGSYTVGMEQKKKRDGKLQSGNRELFEYFCHWSMIPEDDREKDEKTLIKFGLKYGKATKVLYEWIEREEFKKISQRAEGKYAHYYMTRVKGNIVKNSRRDAGSQKLALMYFEGWVPKEGRDIDGTVMLMTVGQANFLREKAKLELEEAKKVEVTGGNSRLISGGENLHTESKSNTPKG